MVRPFAVPLSSLRLLQWLCPGILICTRLLLPQCEKNSTRAASTGSYHQRLTWRVTFEMAVWVKCRRYFSNPQLPSVKANVSFRFGEDSWLNGYYATIFISTMQEKDTLGFMKVATTIKHYVYGSSTGGINQASMLGGSNYIYNYLALPYINVMKTTQPASVMPSYATIDGNPAHSNSYLPHDILRRQLGFSGVIVSDADAIPMIYQTHKTSSSINDAAIQSLVAGVDLELAIGFLPRSKLSSGIRLSTPSSIT